MSRPRTGPCIDLGFFNPTCRPLQSMCNSSPDKLRITVLGLRGIPRCISPLCVCVWERDLPTEASPLTAFKSAVNSLVVVTSRSFNFPERLRESHEMLYITLWDDSTWMCATACWRRLKRFLGGRCKEDLFARPYHPLPTNRVGYAGSYAAVDVTALSQLSNKGLVKSPTTWRGRKRVSSHWLARAASRRRDYL